LPTALVDLEIAVAEQLEIPEEYFFAFQRELNGSTPRGIGTFGTSEQCLAPAARP
jgi:hypothetical protein